jgi:hypothetical protein
MTPPRRAPRRARRERAGGATKAAAPQGRPSGLSLAGPTALFEWTGRQNTLSAARELAAQIESETGVVAASPVKTRRESDTLPARWSVRVSLGQGEPVETIRAMEGVTEVNRTLVTSDASEGAAEGFRNLAITLALVYGTGAVGAGYLTYRYLTASSNSDDS